MQREDAVRLRHMIEATETALEFVAGRVREDLDTDRMLLFALVRPVEISGEAASRVAEDARKDAAGIPWPAIVGMRNRLIHAYFDTNRDILWKTVTAEFPPLLTALRAVRLADIE